MNTVEVKKDFLLKALKKQESQEKEIKELRHAIYTLDDDLLKLEKQFKAFIAGKIG